MINASAQFIQAVQSGRTDYKLTISMLLKNGGTLTLTEDEIWGDTAKIEDATAQGEDFTVGAFVSTKFSFSINNMDGTYTDDSVYDFIDAELTNVSLGLELGGAVEYISLGRFWVDSVDYNGSLISFVCTDRARLFNRPYQSAYNSGTATLRQLLTEAVVACTGSSSHLMSEAFPNETYAVKLPFSHDSMTYADLVAMVAQLAGCFAKFDNSGVLRLAWHPVISSAIPASSRYDPVYAEQHGYHVIKSLKSAKIQKHDCVITKITVTEEVAEGEPGTASYPSNSTDDYVIAVSGNRLISAGQALTAARAIRQNVNDRAFRPLEVATLTNPLIEAGDVMYVVTNDGSKYFSFVTSRSMLLGSGVTIQCAGTPATVKAQTSYTELSKAIAKEREQRNVAAQRGEVARAALENSIYSSLGLHYTEEAAPGGGVIKYYHDGSTLEGSKYIWKFDADSITVSSDGGATWSGAFDARGNALLKYLAVDNLDADWINAGTIDADLIKTGIISDGNNNYWNLQTGDVHFSSIGETIVTAVENEYGVSNSAATPPAQWSKGSPAWEPGKYIWQRTTTVYSEGPPDVNTVCIQGIKGADGRDGAGVSIKGSKSSDSELPATGNEGDAWMVGSDLYVWDATNNRWNNVGQIKGDKGDTGDAGADGVSVTSITPLYAINTDGDHAPAYNLFTTDIPEWQEGKFIWSCVLVGFSDGTAQYSTRVVDGALNTVNASYHEFVNNSEELRNSYERLEHYVGYSKLIASDGRYITTSADQHIGVMADSMSELLEETTRTLRSELQQTAESITAGVAETYETKTAASEKYSELQAGINITSDAINSAVERIENVEYFAVVSHIITNDGRYIVTGDSTSQNPKYLSSVSGAMLDRLSAEKTQIDQRADAIELSAVKHSELNGEQFEDSEAGISIKADVITQSVRDNLTNNYSTTVQTAQAISDAVSGKVDSDDFTSYQVQVKDRIDSVVAKNAEQDKLAGIYGIEATGDHTGTIVTTNGDRITAFIGDIYDRLSLAKAETATAIQQTEDKITALATDIDGQIAAIEIEANRITSRVADAENNVSIIRQTADGLVIDMSNKVTKGDATVLSTGLEWTNDGKIKFKLSDVIANIKNGLDLTFGDIDGLGSRFTWTAADGLQMVFGQNSNLEWDNSGNLKVKVNTLNLSTGNIRVPYNDGSEKYKVLSSAITADDNGIHISTSVVQPMMRWNDSTGRIEKLNTSTGTYEEVSGGGLMYGKSAQGNYISVNDKLNQVNTVATNADAAAGAAEELAEQASTDAKIETWVNRFNRSMAGLVGDMFAYTQVSDMAELDDGSLELTSTGLLSLFNANQLVVEQSKINLSPTGVKLAWSNFSDYIKFEGDKNTPALKFKYGTGANDYYSIINKDGMRFYGEPNSNNDKPLRSIFSKSEIAFYKGAYDVSVPDSSKKANPRLLTIDASGIEFYSDSAVKSGGAPLTLMKISGSDGVVINYANTEKKFSTYGSSGLTFYRNDSDNTALGFIGTVTDMLNFPTFGMYGLNNYGYTLKASTSSNVELRVQSDGFKFRDSTNANQHILWISHDSTMSATGYLRDYTWKIFSTASMWLNGKVYAPDMCTSYLRFLNNDAQFCDIGIGKDSYNATGLNFYLTDGFVGFIRKATLAYILQIQPTAVNAYTNWDFNGYSISRANIISYSSDARLKKNISPSTVKALEALTAIDMKSYDWIKDNRHVKAGIIAQQLQNVAPELVVGKDELAISTTDLLNYCVKAIQELAEMVGYKPKKKAEWTDPYTLDEKLEYVKHHTGG